MKRLALLFVAAVTVAGCQSSTGGTIKTPPPTTTAASVDQSSSQAPAPSSTTPAAAAAITAQGLTTAQKQAESAAKNYLSLGSGFSRQGLIDQLSSSAGSGFSVPDATAAVDSLNVDWNAQAVLAAKSYLTLGTGFSHAGLVAQLDSAAGGKFTPAQAEYGASHAGL